MRNIYIVLILSIMHISFVYAQDLNKYDSIEILPASSKEDSISIKKYQVMSSFYYSSRNTFNRNYNFELYNKQRKLRMWSNEVRIFGYASFLGVCFIGPLLFPDTSLWILIPAEILVGGGILYGTNMWANHLRRKSDAIVETSISVLEIDSQSSLYVSYYNTKLSCIKGIGVSYKYSF